jgi:hypothetical protein
MKRRDSRAAAKKGWRVRKQMRAARAQADDITEVGEDWFRNAKLVMPNPYKRVLPNPFLTME